MKSVGNKSIVCMNRVFLGLFTLVCFCVNIKNLLKVFFMNVNEFSDVKQYINPGFYRCRPEAKRPSGVDEKMARLGQSLNYSHAFNGNPLMGTSKKDNWKAIFFNQCDKIDPKPTIVSIKNGKFLGIEMDSDETFQEAFVPEIFFEMHSEVGEVEEVKQASPVKVYLSKKVLRENLIKQLIASEDKLEPLSDGAISRKMTEHGFLCARRTVTSIRSRLKIPGSQERIT